MIFGANAQNKNLTDAASKKVDTSPRTETSNRYSATIASSKNTSSGADSSGPPSTSYAKKPTNSDPIKGSFEGYMGGASTYIQMEKSGYLNPAIQKARYNKLSVNANKSIGQGVFTKPSKSTILNDNTRTGSSNDSSARIREIDKRNNTI